MKDESRFDTHFNWAIWALLLVLLALFGCSEPPAPMVDGDKFIVIATDGSGRNMECTYESNDWSWGVGWSGVDCQPVSPP